MSILSLQSLKQLSCVLWWPGSFASNVSGVSNGFPILPDGVAVTPNGTFTSQRLKNGLNCYKFDGSTNRMSLSNNDAWFYYNGNFTICFWIKAPTSASTILVLSQYDGTNYVEVYYSPGDSKWNIAGNGVGNHKCVSALPNNTFTYVSISHTGSTSYMYINGISQPVEIATAWTSQAKMDAPLIINGESPSIYSPTNIIKDLMIFKRALTLDQLGALMAETFIY